ncbi:MAG: hypothetical protein Q9227_002388 [Pyrenula ochraceoflavens]
MATSPSSSLFYTTFTYTHTSTSARAQISHSSSPSPPSAIYSRALSLLHEHSNIITLNPLVTSHHPISPDSSSTLLPPPTDSSSPDPETSSLSPWKAYAITDTKPLLCGLYNAKIPYKAYFRNNSDGYDSVVQAGFGVTIHGSWTLNHLPATQEGEEEGVRLVEEARIKCPRVVAGTVKGELESSHRVLHGRFWERVYGAEQEA